MIKVDLPYMDYDTPDSHLPDVADWLAENVGGPAYIEKGMYCGKGWKIYHTSAMKGGPYPTAFTRAEFEQESAATLFMLRWS